MPYNTNELISDAYYASGVVSREFETVSGGQVADGLKWLNNIITEKNVDDGMIPFEDTVELNFIANQEKYFIEGLIAIDTIVFYLQSVRYAMRFQDRNRYFGTSRAENISTLPFEWYFERALGGGNLYVYFKPDQNYPVLIKGSKMLPPVALFQDLSLSYEEFYTTYLKWALVDRICSEYNFTTPPNALRQLGKYEAFIASKSKTLDLTVERTSTLQKRGSYNYAQINIGRGFMPPS